MKRPDHLHHPDRGFTLIEVLVVVIIVGILALIAAPGWLAYVNRQRLTAVRSDLVAVLKQAQVDAKQRRSTVTISLGAGENVPQVNGLLAQFNNDALAQGLVQLAIKDGDGDAITSFSFDYQGLPNVVTSEPLPWVLDLSIPDLATQQCVIVANLVGSIKTAEGDDCTNPSVDPQ